MASPSRTANERRLPVFLLALPAFLAFSVLLLASPARALRVVDYNILNYPGNTGALRAPYYQTILAPLGADVIVTEEMSNPAGPAEFLNEVLNVIEPGQWATVQLIDGNDTDASLFYKPAKVQFLGQSAFYPYPANPLRLVHVFRLRPIGYASAGANLRIYTAHLKASTGYESQRLAECAGLRDSMNTMPVGTHALICGDMNFYKQSTEPGYAKLLESQTNNVGRVFDMLPAGEWHDGGGFAPYHTQSPCLNGTCANGAATGGLDDRFDMILPTLNFGTGQGLAVIPHTCISVGNDGQHLNKNITDAPTIPEGAGYALALKLASDHLPLRLDFQVPSMITVTPASLDFGTVIVDAPPQSQDLSVSNPATPPADSLNCTFGAPDGFGAPGPLAVAAGASAPATVTMSAPSAGAMTGNLTVFSDAPDNPSVLVSLSGTVLDHAVASLDSTVTVLTSAVDFGDHETGGFTNQTVRLYNEGYYAYQARLLVSNGIVTGGGGRFSLVGGFTGVLIGGTGQGFTLSFDDTGAARDSTYTATLTFTSSDEALPGATGQPNLAVSLRARVIGGQSDTSGNLPPATTHLYAPSPNPAVGNATLRLDIARAVEGSVAIFDPSGRRVATLRRGAFAPGRYALTWDGRRQNGTFVGSGIYFVRFSAPSMRTQTVRVALVR